MQRLSDVPTRTEALDAKAPSYRQTSIGDGWRVSATYVTDPARPSMVVDLDVESLTGEPLDTYVIHEPTLSKDGSDDRSSTRDGALVARDGSAASALLAEPAFTATSSGYLGASDGWTDLSEHKRLTELYGHAGPGNVGQVGRLPVDGVESTHVEITLGSGATGGRAEQVARLSSQARVRRARRALPCGVAAVRRDVEARSGEPEQRPPDRRVLELAGDAGRQ